MSRIEVHCHFLPALDDGCQSLGESLECLRMMLQHGYTRLFCTPHCGSPMFQNLPTSEVARQVRDLARHAQAEKIPLEIRPGGELRLTADVPEAMPHLGVPTFGHSGKYVLADLWEHTWPDWANRSVEWLQSQGYIVIIAHPERMPVLLADHSKINDIAKLGVLFQGNLGPIGGNDTPPIVKLAQRYLQDGRYFMVGSDGHRPKSLPTRLQGLQKIEELVGPEKLHELTAKNPSRLWA